MKPFIVEVASVEEGVRLMDALADYDAFQYDNNIKPDYCNANGLEMWDESLTDEDLSEMGLTDRWVDWYSECQCYDDPRKYIESLKEEIRFCLRSTSSAFLQRRLTSDAALSALTQPESFSAIFRASRCSCIACSR
ncbi:TPA: hypothetical protein RVE58_001342 [Escherichia coli]|nr:hypothetical protein [Escherichia coli]HEA1420265.1 hypothetical protein [Escherichia coli]